MATDKIFHETFLNKINSSKIKTRSMMGSISYTMMAKIGGL